MLCYDVDGNRYLDLISGIGVNSLGYAHPRITGVIRQQAGLILHTSNLYYNEFQGKLAERLAKVSGLKRSFFCNSGAEAMESGLKMIRAHGRGISASKYEVVLDRRLVSWPDTGCGLSDRPAEISEGFRAAAPGRAVCPAQRCACARAGGLR